MGNKMAEVAQMFGKEIEHEFKVFHPLEGEVYVTFTLVGVCYRKSKTDKRRWSAAILMDMLVGQAVIVDA